MGTLLNFEVQYKNNISYQKIASYKFHNDSEIWFIKRKFNNESGKHLEKSIGISRNRNKIKFYFNLLEIT